MSPYDQAPLTGQASPRRSLGVHRAMAVFIVANTNHRITAREKRRCLPCRFGGAIRPSRPSQCPKVSRTRPRARRLCHEPLEERRLLSFSYADFSDPTGLDFVAEAAITNDRMQLTPPDGSSTVSEGGCRLHTEKQFVDTPFETQFEFQRESATGFRVRHPESERRCNGCRVRRNAEQSCRGV